MPTSGLGMNDEATGAGVFGLVPLEQVLRDDAQNYLIQVRDRDYIMPITKDYQALNWLEGAIKSKVPLLANGIRMGFDAVEWVVYEFLGTNPISDGVYNSGGALFHSLGQIANGIASHLGYENQVNANYLSECIHVPKSILVSQNLIFTDPLGKEYIDARGLKELTSLRSTAGMLFNVA